MGPFGTLLSKKLLKTSRKKQEHIVYKNYLNMTVSI